MDDADLARFVAAQSGGVYERAIDELRRGRKSSHWMWFLFPQLRGLGRSETSRFYGLDGIDEAAAYVAHPVLGPRLLATFEAVLAAPGSADSILGAVDAMKLRSSATLFERATPDQPLFANVLDQFYDGMRDAITIELLDKQATSSA
jgi:uncharacterized protein (DUF1810 family)